MAIIAAIGGLAARAAGLAGYFGAINNLGQVQAIGMMAGGSGAALISTIAAVFLKKFRPQTPHSSSSHSIFSTEDLRSLDEWASQATEGEQREEAKRRILECDGVELSLWHLNLKTVPKEIGKLTKLTELHLGDNQLAELPECIGELAKLTELKLTGNRLAQMPECIGELTNLTKLHLFRNQLTQMPECIGELTNLTELYLGGNQLTQMPECIGELTNLTTLILFRNQLTQLPECIGELTNLTALYLNNNPLTQMPECIGELTNLTTLYLRNNQLTQMPEWIGELTNLTALDLGNNQLTQMPECIGRLTNLTTLYLRNNQLTQMPECIGELTNLTGLDLGNNQLTQLPECIGELTNLTGLYLSNNQLTQLPECIGRLTNLTELYLGSNQLFSLPNSIYVELSSNCFVSLEQNPISTNTLSRIQERARDSGPRITFSIQDRSTEDRSLPELLDDLYRVAEVEALELKELAGNEYLALWLNRLVDVRDYKRSETRQNLCKKIYETIKTAEEDPVYRGVFLSTIKRASKRCGDRVALSILYVDLQLEIKKAVDDKDLTRLAYLLRGSMALNELEKIARQKIDDLHAVDPIEVYLAYPIKLKKRLNLPIVLNKMSFFKVSCVTKDDLKNAEDVVKSLIDNRDTYIDYLINNKTWIEALTARYPTEVEAIKKSHEDKANGKNPDYMQIQKENDNALRQLTQKVFI